MISTKKRLVTAVSTSSSPASSLVPGVVDTTRHGVYVTGPLFGPGALWKLH
jgi:hypothetical protein